MRRIFATHLHYILLLMVVYPMLIVCGVSSGVGLVVMTFCMAAVHVSGRYTEHLDNRLLALEQKDVDA